MFRWVHELSEVPRADWERLWSCGERLNPFMSPSFLVPWAETFAAGRQQRIGLWSHQGRVAGMIFLYAAFRGWELLGGQDVSDRLGPLLEPGLEEPFWQDFLRDFGERPVTFPNQVEGESTLRLPGRIEETDRSPFLPLPASFDLYLAGLSKKQRHELQRKLRKAERLEPELSVRGTEGGALDDFTRLHRLSHPEKEAFMQGDNLKFFLRLQETMRPRIDYLCAAGVPVAAMYQLLCGGRTYLYNSGFDPRFREMAPGVVLLSHCIASAIARGDREFDFLRGSERYKYDLGALDRGVYRITLE